MVREKAVVSHFEVPNVFSISPSHDAEDGNWNTDIVVLPVTSYLAAAHSCRIVSLFQNVVMTGTPTERRCREQYNENRD
jgi:hypothetical protein